MIKFSTRSSEKELLDGRDIPQEAVVQNMKELNVINTYLGGHRITLKGFTKLLGTTPKVHVLEIGCGGGDNLKVIKQYCDSKGIEVILTGIDINSDIIDFAKAQLPDAVFICNDYSKVVLENKPDIVFSSLFCHHFSNQELIHQLQWMKEQSNIGFFINDLHRHPLAYYSIRWITQLLSSSYLVKHDAPISVLSGFKKEEWEALAKPAGLTPMLIRWMWAFRYLIIYRHG